MNATEHPRTTTFLIVMGHHPIYTDGDHPVLIKEWDPVFRRQKVDVYLAGHDHDLQCLEFEGHPTSLFYSGGGGADLGELMIHTAKRGPYTQKVYGFSHLSVPPNRIQLRHLDSDGRRLHAFSRTKDGKVLIEG